MTSPNELLKEARIAAGYEHAADFAAKHGLTESTYRSAENGHRGLSIPTAKQYAKLLGIPWQSLFDATSVPEKVRREPVRKDRIVEIAGVEFAKLPVRSIRFSAGAGAAGSVEEFDERPVDYHIVSMSFLRSMTDAPVTMIEIFQVDGDSMQETINNRDWVMVDRRRTNLKNPGIYAMNIEGDGVIKRASQHIETGVVTLSSDNPRYRPQIQTIKKAERLIVIGRVFLSIRRH